MCVFHPLVWQLPHDEKSHILMQVHPLPSGREKVGGQQLVKGHEGSVLSSNPYTTLPLRVGDILSLLPSATAAATEKTSPLRGGHLQVDLFLLELLIKCHTKNTQHRAGFVFGTLALS